MNGIFVAHFFFIRNGKQIKRSRRRLGFPHGFQRRHFGFLRLADAVARFVAQHQHRQNRRHAESGSDAEAFLGKFHILLAQDIPAGNRQHKHGARHITCRHGVHKFILRIGIEHHFEKAGHLHAHGFEIKHRTHRILHPAVGHQNPQGRKIGAQGHKNGYHQMLAARHSFPAEKEKPHQRGFEEKGHQPFQRQRCAENIADIMRVIRPVGAELKFHRDACGHAQGKVDAEKFAPKLGHVAVDFLAGHHIHCFHDNQNPRQAQSERHKQEMVHNGNRKLQPR